MILETLLPVLSTLGSATVLKPSRPERKKKQANKWEKVENKQSKDLSRLSLSCAPCFCLFALFSLSLECWLGKLERRHFRKEADSSGFKGPNRCHHQREVRFYTTNYFVLEENGCPALCQKKDKPNKTRVG